jgi:hypothetical protein
MRSHKLGLRSTARSDPSVPLSRRATSVQHYCSECQKPRSSRFNARHPGAVDGLLSICSRRQCRGAKARAQAHMLPVVPDQSYVLVSYWVPVEEMRVPWKDKGVPAHPDELAAYGTQCASYEVDGSPQVLVELPCTGAGGRKVPVELPCGRAEARSSCSGNRRE